MQDLKGCLVPILWYDNLDKRLILLRTYRKFLSNMILCHFFGNSYIEILESLLDENWEIVPFLPYKCDDESYVAWIRKNVNRFKALTVGNFNQEIKDSSFQYGYLHGNRSVKMNEYNSIISYADGLPNLCLSPFESVVELDAWLFRKDINNAVLLKYMKKNAVFGIVYHGYWCLFRDFAEQNKAGYFRNKDVPGDGPWIDPLDLGTGFHPEGCDVFPYNYYKTYLQSGFDWYSGIGYLQGAARHHLRLLVEYGYKGAVFYVPVNDKEMQIFLTDIERT